MLKVWNYQKLDFPREGLNPLLPAEDCQFTMRLKYEAAQKARLVQFDLPEVQELPQFQRQLRARLWKKFGTVYDPTLPLDIQSYGTVKGDGFTVEKIIYQSRPGLYVTALLYIPAGPGPFPAVVNLHGHNMEGKFSERVQTVAQTIVKSGYICISPDAFGVYERAHRYMTKEYHGAILGSGLLNIGETLMGAQVVDNMKAVDVLLSRSDVQKDKIGATGGSGGGNQTMWLAAMDERIAAAMPVVSVGSFESYATGINCMCELLPDGLELTEEGGVLALIAPRPLRIGNALYDVNPDFAVGEMLKTYRGVEQLYRKLGVPDNIAYTVSPRPHGMLREQREAMLGWFALHLKGVGHGGALPEPEVRIFPESELQMFASGAERPPKVQSIPDYCRQIGEAQLQQLAVNQDGAVKRCELQQLLRLAPLPDSINCKSYHPIDGWERLALSAGNRLIPVLLKRGKTHHFQILVHPGGKDKIAPEQLLNAEQSGDNVVLLDLSGTGETANPNNLLGEFHQFFRQLLWLGHLLIGEWVADLLLVKQFLQTQDPAATVEIKGAKEAGLAAVLAGAVDGNIPVTTQDAPASLLFKANGFDTFEFGSDPHPHHFYSIILGIPGFVAWGDVGLAVALNQAPVTFESPRYFDGTAAPIPHPTFKIQ